MAQAIENAITALQYKDADYTKVDEAIAKANALNKDAYTNFTAVETAINAVVRDKNITEQDKVDAMAKAIEDAMAALVEKPTEAPTATPTVKPTATPTPAPKADPNNPKTGSSNLPVVFGSAALVLSGGALAAVLIYKKKRHEK